MAEVNRTDPIGLPLDRVDGHLKVTGKATMPLNTPRKAVPPTVSSFPRQSPRGASLPSTSGTHSALPVCCWC